MDDVFRTKAKSAENVFLKRVGIIQSAYIPWMGYLDFIASVDEFVFLDDVQFTRRDWRSRNRIRTRYGDRWLSIPLHQSGNFEAKINEMKVCDPIWDRRHFDSIRQAYFGARNWKKYADELEWCYIDSPQDLSNINRRFIELGCKWLNIKTKLSWSTDHPSSGAKSEKLLEICRQAGATSYLSGPLAKNYLDEKLFGERGITVKWMTYRDWPKLTFLHVLFNEPRFS